MPAADDTLRYDNERRVARMRVWINSAETLPASEAHAHLRFVLYWIAYEAAYKVYKVYGDASDKPERRGLPSASDVVRRTQAPGDLEPAPRIDRQVARTASSAPILLV